MDLPMIPSEPAEPITSEIRTICVIGAGPTGLAALKVILETPQYKSGQWSATAFESRDRVGGVWAPAPPVEDPPLTPLYDSLTTNLPHPVMAFTSYSFPPSTPLFPCASVVQKYLDDYADYFKLRPNIRFSTTVRSVEREESQWRVGLSTGETAYFHLVIVCNGHYKIPRYPSTPGIAQWLNSGRASHSAWYRHPRDLGDTVLIVGGGPSGQDISAEMRTAAATVIHSVTGGIREDSGNLKRRGRAVEFRNGGEVLFDDGTSESGITHCILATGYQFSFPFLSDVMNSQFPPPAPPLPRELYNSTYHVFPLAKHLFPLQMAFPPTSLAFLGLLMRVAPLPLAEAQARAVVEAFAHPATLDTTNEAVDIITRQETLRTELGDDLAIAKGWHKFKEHEQFDYRDDLYRFAAASHAGGDAGYNEVPEWEREMYYKKDILRKTWVALEKSGEAQALVQGVGEGGPHEWVDFMRKILKIAAERGIVVKEIDKSRL